MATEKKSRVEADIESLETGTFTEPVEYICEIAFARKERYESK